MKMAITLFEAFRNLSEHREEKKSRLKESFCAGLTSKSHFELFFG